MIGRTIGGAILVMILCGCGRGGEPAPPADSGAGADRAQSDRAVDPYDDFGLTASNVFFYYADVEAATTFYTEILGLRVVADYGFAKILRVAPKSFLTLVDAAEGMHAADEPKTTAIALITDQLDEWWEYIRTQDVELRSAEYDPVEGRPHHGFVAIDPEGYFLEFERFNPHPENERLIPVLAATETLFPEPGASNVPPGLGFKSTVVWFYYRDMDRIQRFYEDVMGFDMIVDQGWTKIYRVGPTGYFGLVDETRGMHRYTEQKGVTMSFLTDSIDLWFDYLANRGDVEMRHEAIVEEEPYRAFVAYDPEGYYLEWDVFNDVAANRELLEAVNAP